LSYDASQDSIAEFFSKCGEITRIRIATDREGDPKGFCHIEFANTTGAENAVTKNGEKLDGRSIRVDFSGAKAPSSGGRGGYSGRGGSRGSYRGSRGGYEGRGRGGYESRGRGGYESRGGYREKE